MSKYMSPITNDSLINLCSEISINDKINVEDYNRYNV